MGRLSFIDQKEELTKHLPAEFTFDYIITEDDLSV